jgi:acyl-CoA synthetase (AMP-forming)/AMP-acid ligase II
LYAGVQVILQCFANRGCLAVSESDASPAAIAQFMRDAHVQFASATASYWRRLVLFAPAAVLREVPLVQITLGGEVVDQQILDALRANFPQARLTHIYATTELGRCFSVSDAKAGFPISLLDGPSQEGTELRIADGELLARSRNSMPSISADWFHTGDMVEIVGDRVFFVSRRSEIINVGGNKVHPIEVERVIRQVSGVSDVRVYGKRSSIAGELVACEIVAADGRRDVEEVRNDVKRRCIDELAPFQRPRLIHFVSEISLERSGKTTRRQRP